MQNSPAEVELEARIEELRAERDRIDRQIEGLRVGLRALRGEVDDEPRVRRPTTQRILELLERGPMTRLELAESLGDADPDRLSSLLSHLGRRGEVARVGRGKWGLSADE